ncbi:MAG: class I tRNA ligase family protein, partial [Candidatus Omnitrophica bacterium]|nr:class I tRNA ligase family protein [Candidatus Omnitrophota bacterium]
NGNIHMGHVLNKTLKDIVIKYWTMKGFDSSYVPGWDCHGLPIEHQLLKELRMRKHQVPQVEFRRKAHEYAMKYVQVQRGQFKRLGIFGDWDNPYLTLSREYEETIVRSFGALVEKGYVYRGLKPVNWCPDCETALAEAEVEYEDHVSPSVSVKFALEKNDLFPDNTALVIWTTTPWTLIANVAVAAHPEYTYVLVKTSGGHLVLAEDLCESVCAGAGYQDVQVLRKCKGKDMEGLTYAHPLGLRQGKVVLADYVSRAEGTGLVHTAPGHGNEDFLTGLRYGLPVIMPVDSRGRFDDTCERVRGEPVFQANARIIELLEECGALVSSEELRHSYPHCWRCKKPVIFRATNQWFLNLGHLDLRARLVKAVDEEVSWTPAAGRERIRAMVEMRPDWCLSRQRHWGVPIPSLICEDCSDEFLAPSVITRFADYVRQEGSDCWFKRDVADFAAGDVTCPRCGGRRLRKGIDILDVWFDSGVSHQAVVKKRPELGDLPCELYLEGSDQHRGWFQSSLIPSLCLDGRAP